MGDLYLPESGTKVNRLEQPFHLRGGLFPIVCLRWPGKCWRKKVEPMLVAEQIELY